MTVESVHYVDELCGILAFLVEADAEEVDPVLIDIAVEKAKGLGIVDIIADIGIEDDVDALFRSHFLGLACNQAECGCAKNE